MSGYKGQGHPDAKRRLYGAADDDERHSGFLSGIHHARVTNNKDPEKQGRIKVRYNWMDETQESGWVGQHSNTGLGPTNLQRGRVFGMDWPLPEVGSMVSIYFANGDVYDPWYFGAPRYQEGGTGVPDLEKDDKRDWSLRFALQNGAECGFDTEGNFYLVCNQMRVLVRGSAHISAVGVITILATKVRALAMSVLRLFGVTIDQSNYPRPEEKAEVREMMIDAMKQPPGRQDPGIGKISDLE